MSQFVYPATPKYVYPVKRSAEMKTLRQEASSGLEAVASLWLLPIWHWELTYDLMDAAVAGGEFQTLVDFFLARRGAFDTFLFVDLDDQSVTDQTFGIGNGSTVAFQLNRALIASGFAEPIYNLNGTPVIKDAGVTKTAGVDYNINATGLVTFTYTPVAGHALTWTGSYYFRCRFEEDLATFEKFARRLYKNATVKLRSVKGA